MLKLEEMQQFGSLRYNLLAVFIGLMLVLPVWVYSAGLVPCGGPDEEPCQTCHVVSLMSNVINWLIVILGFLAVLVIIYAGIRLVTSAGNTSAMESAKKILTNMIIGYVIVLAGWLIIDYGIKALVNESKFGPWNVIECVTQEQIKFNKYIDYVDLGNQLSLGRAALDVSLIPSSVIDPSAPVVTPRFSPGSGAGSLGSCKVAASGPCSEPELRRAGFGNLAGDAARIVGQESGCNPNAESRTDTTTDGRTFSVGTWQINLAVHPLRCTMSTGQQLNLNCPTAFRRTNLRNQYRVRMYDVIDENLYRQCVQAAKDPHCNNQIAAGLATRSGDMGDWACSSKKCGVRTTRNHLCPL